MMSGLVEAHRQAKPVLREPSIGRFATRGLYYLALVMLVVLALASLMPLYWMISGSFKIQTDAIKVPPEWFPVNPTLENYRKLFLGRSLTFRWFANSFIVAGGVAFFGVVTSSMAGYAFGKKKFPGQTFLFWLLIITMALPKQISLIPLFILMRDLHWFNSYQGMIAPHVAYPFGVFLMKQFMQNIPQDLIDAARIDGASEVGIFWKIILPLSRPVVGALAIFAFMAGWNDYIWQLLMVTKTPMLTLPIGISKLVANLTSYDVGLAMAGATFAFIPMLLVFIFFQDYFVKGITVGALKG